MPILKIRDGSGNFVDIPALVGPKGADGTMTFEELTDAQKESLRGPAGPAGPAGADGATGATGPAGKSAYQTAVDAGYTGTEADFNAALKNAPGHISDTTKHITADERNAWNGKAAGTHASQHASGGSDPITPAAIGAVNKTGDTMTGSLSVAGGYNSITGDSNSAIFQYQNNGNRYGYVVYPNLSDGEKFQVFRSVDGTVTQYPIYHAGNKPKFSDIAFLGINPISSTTDDTTTNWGNLGSGFAWYNAADKLNGQPSQYGHLISYIQGADVFQIWNTQSGGPTYFRSGNGAGWNGTWRKVYDTSNKPTPADIGAAASSHTHSASEITSGTLSAARGGTGQTTITPAVTTKAIRASYAGTSSMTASSTSLTTGMVYYQYE